MIASFVDGAMGPSVYVYQGDLLCEDCGEKVREDLTKAGNAPEDPGNEHSYDSDDYPKGPYPDGGGEADSPQHCGAGEECLNAEICPSHEDHKLGLFLENPLTQDGYDYIKECLRFRDGCVAREVWADFYDVDPGEE